MNILESIWEQTSNLHSVVYAKYGFVKFNHATCVFFFGILQVLEKNKRVQFTVFINNLSTRLTLI